MFREGFLGGLGATVGLKSLGAQGLGRVLGLGSDAY